MTPDRKSDTYDFLLYATVCLLPFKIRRIRRLIKQAGIINKLHNNQALFLGKPMTGDWREATSGSKKQRK